MVILIASDDPGIRGRLAGRLRESTDHRILAAASVEEMEALPEQEGFLDLLVFSPVFSEAGRQARARLRSRFPGLRVMVLDDAAPLEQSVAALMGWVGGDEPASGAGAGAGNGNQTGNAGAQEGKSWEFPAEADRPSLPAEAGPSSVPEVDSIGKSPDGEAGFSSHEAGFPSREAGDSELQDGENEEPVPEFPGKGAEEGDGPQPVILGDYELRELMQSTEMSLIYRAVQRSVRRTVALECLRPELSDDPAAAKRFRQLVRARALVSHPVIAAVYEAQETGEALFHTFELVPGENLTALAAAGRQFSQQVLLSMLQAAADAVVWMEEHDIPHEAVRPGHLLLDPNGTPRLQNVASVDASAGQDTVSGSLAQLAAVCQRLSEPRSAQTRELAHVLGLMRSPGSHGIHTWKALAREARNSLQRLTEAHTSVIPESRERVLARRRRGRHLLLWGVTAAALTAGMAGGVMGWRRSARAKIRNLDGLVRIPAGPFLFQEGRTVDLPEFWIDRHEVTLAQYAAFLEALGQGAPDRFDHPDQPTGKTSHQPRDWEEIHRAAAAAGTWHGHSLTLNSPVFNVDWWDAWAFAKWKGRRLPTEQEWEKAARGGDGRLWPWGNEANPRLANTGADYAEHPGAGGREDGHAWWCDVDAMPGDRSAEGVMGMAGNVAEWTSTLVPDPDLPDVEVPVFRGGDFHQTAPVPLNAGPWLAKGALYAQPFLGFRTASSTGEP